jgi:hypothetical protein
MKVLTEAESREFLRRHNLGEELRPLSPETCHDEVETDIGTRYAYANLFTNHLIDQPESVACVDITDWAVWPSSQNLDLFYSYRRYLGEKRRLIDAHFHVFNAGEAKELRNIIHLGLISLFDVAGASTTTDFRFYASHDEWIQTALYEGAPWERTTRWFFDE